MSIILRVPEDLHTQFKEYCISKDTTMSKILIDYITTLVNTEEKDVRKRIVTLLKSIKEEDLPGEEKNSVKTYYCGCGLDLSTLPTQDRLDHVKNCQSARKE